MTGPVRTSPLARGALALLRGYQLGLSPLLGSHCRHLPSCSEYARQAIERFGLLRGGWLAARRLARCHPWGTQGFDPLPDSPQQGSSPRPGTGS